MVMNTVLNIKLDPDLKRQAQEAAKAIGLPISTVVAAGLREFVRTRSITISDPPKLKPEVEAELLQISADAKKGINVSPTFDNLDDAFTWLDAEDDD
jgi:antitoxin component of RelBE/YafQ-DinJ toxin-antitoxin module